MHKEKIFIIGGGKLQVDFIKTVQKNGYQAFVFDYDPDCPGGKIADVFHCISIDDKSAILEIAKKEGPLGIHTVATELGNVTSAYVGEDLGLDVNTYETALNTVDKDRMKRVFETFKIPTAKVKRLYSKEDLYPLEMPLPVVVKASDRSAGRGVTLVEKLEDLEGAYEVAYAASHNKIVLLETYLKGDQYSVELVSQKGVHHILGVTREYFVDEKDFVESHYLFPAFNEAPIIKAHGPLFYQLLDAFDIQYGASHIEFRIDSHQNIHIIEIASRMGGMRDDFLKIAKGCDYNQCLLEAITQKPLDLTLKKEGYALGKSMFTPQDAALYRTLVASQPDALEKAPEIKVIGEGGRPKTLMDAKAIYYLKVEDPERARAIIDLWEESNREMESRRCEA